MEEEEGREAARGRRAHVCLGNADWSCVAGTEEEGQRDGPWPKQGWQANELGQWEVPWSF